LALTLLAITGINMTEVKLTAKQSRFIEEYVIDFNATQAAIRAGYSEKTAGQIGEQNLKKLEIADAIKLRMDKLTSKAEITVEKILADLEELRDMCMGRVPVTQTVLLRDSEGASLPTEVTQRVFESSGAKGALELLGKYKKMFTDKQEITGKDGGAQQVEVSMTVSALSKVKQKTSEMRQIGNATVSVS
jgi:phage terminase small subunit